MRTAALVETNRTQLVPSSHREIGTSAYLSRTRSPRIASNVATGQVALSALCPLAGAKGSIGQREALFALFVQVHHSIRLRQEGVDLYRGHS